MAEIETSHLDVVKDVVVVDKLLKETYKLLAGINYVNLRK